MEKYQSSLGVTITGGLTEAVTPWAGAVLLVELYRKAGIKATVKRVLPQKKSAKGLRQEHMVESFVLLSTRTLRALRFRLGRGRIIPYFVAGRGIMALKDLSGKSCFEIVI